MNLNKSYKIYKMMNTVKQVNKTLWFFHYLIPFFHLLCIILFMLLNILPQVSLSSDIIAQILIKIRDNYLTFDMGNIYVVVGLFISFFLTLLGFIRLKFIPNYDELQQYKKLQKILFICSVSLGYAYEIGIFLFAWSFSEIYKNEGFFLALLKCIFTFVGYMYFSNKYSLNSLYGWFTVPITVLITTINNPASYIIVMLISFYLIIYEKNLIKKVFCGFVAIIALFTMKNSQLFQEAGAAQMQISFMCLGILVVLTPFFIVYIKERLDMSNSQQKLSKTYMKLNKLKPQSPYSQMKFEDFYQLYNTIITYSLSNKDQKSAQIDSILQKEPQNLSKRDLLFLLQKFLQKECQNPSESNILKQIFLFKIKSELEYSPHSIIQNFYLLSEQVQRGTKTYQNQIFEIFDEVIEKYALIKNGDLQPAHLIYLNKLHEDFQSKVYLMLDRFQNFWRYISEQQIKLFTLDSCFQEVLELQSEIEDLYINIEKYGQFEKEKKIIDISRNLYNVYEEVNKYSRSDKKRSESSDSKEFTHAFVILENGVIKFISKDLIKVLGRKGALFYENIDKKILFGRDFSVIIDDLTQSISKSSQDQYNSVPVLTESGTMQLKKIRIMWYPSLEVKSRIIITFSEDLQLSHQAFLIYHFKTDTIKYFNAKFISLFKIDQQKFISQIENYQIFFSELFIQTQVPAEQIKKYLQEENTIRCKIYLKNYVQKGMIPSLPVEVNVLRCIYVNKEPTHCILKVSKLNAKYKIDDFEFIDARIDKNPQRKQFYRPNKAERSSKDSVQARKWAKQKFFCKIANPYESKISQKQAQLQEKNRWVCRYYIHLLFLLTILTVMIFWIMDNSFLSARIQGYRQELISIENTSEQYTLMYQIYSCLAKDYFLSKYPQQTEIARNMSAAFFIGFFKFGEQMFIDQFLNLYLTQINTQPNNDISYKIDFNQFSINTSTHLTTLMDFVENAKKHVINSDYDFMLKNYNNYRDLIIKFQSSSNSQQQIINIVENSKQYFWILVSITSASFLAILFFLIKIEGSINIVYSLIRWIPAAELKQNLFAFEIRRKRIMDIFLLTSADLLKKKTLAMRSANNEKTGTFISFKSGISNEEKEIDEDLSYFLDNQYTKQELNMTKQIENIQHANQSHQQEDTLLNKQTLGKQDFKSRMIQESFLTKLHRKSLFIFLLFIFNGIFVINYMNLANQREGMLQILTLQKSFYSSLLTVKRVEVDAPIRAIMEDYFNKSIPNYLTSQVSLIASLPNQMIFPGMEDFSQKANQALEQSVCQYAQQYVGTPLMAKPCETYLNGIVTKGLRQSYDIFLNNAKILSQQSLSEFGLYPCTVQQCSPYYQHEFSSILLGETSRFMITLLKASVQQAFRQMQTNLKVQTALKMVGLIIIVVFYYIFDLRLRSRCRKAIQYFRIIPKNIMCSMKMTTFIRKNNILDKLQIL